MADEDEDVVFEGSAIHQHLQNIGLSDFEVTEAATQLSQKNPLQSDKDSKIEWLCTKCLDALTWTFWPREFRRNSFMRPLRDICKSRLLITDDQLLLKHFLPDIFSYTNKSSSISSISTEMLFWGVRGLLLATFVGVCSIFFLDGENIGWSSILLSSVVSSLIWLGTVSWMMCRQSSKLRNFFEVLQSMGQLISKSLRLLLEEDLVSRGFFLAQGSSSFPSRHGKEAPHCEALRTSLHKTLYSVLPVLRGVHEYLKTHVSYYPCMRGLFNEFEEISVEQRDDIAEHLKFLKKLVMLVKLQMSAVVTELTLCSENFEVFERILNEDSVLSSHLVAKTSFEKDLLLKHFTYSQSFWQNNMEQENSCEKKKNEVYVAIHSLSLHLQAALFKAQELESKFECTERLDGLDTSVSLPSIDSVNDQLKSIQLELHSCQGCYDETLARVNRKYEIKLEEEKNEDKPIRVAENITPVAMPKQPPIPLFELEKPVIKDEVFEAYIDQEYIDSRDKELDDDFWNTDAKLERKKLKQQKEQGKRVLHELQPLLVKLRGEWEEREALALQRRKADISQAQDNCTPDPGNKTDSKEKEQIDTLTKVEKENRKNKAKSLNNELASTTRENANAISNCCGEQFLKEGLEYDSDDERLEAYRRVRKQLEADEKSYKDTIYEKKDSDDEKLETYRRVRKELEANQESFTEERDSDDERLEAYKKMKLELDEDERQRTSLEVSGSDASRKCFAKLFTSDRTNLSSMETMCGKSEDHIVSGVEQCEGEVDSISLQRVKQCESGVDSIPLQRVEQCESGMDSISLQRVKQCESEIDSIPRQRVKQCESGVDSIPLQRVKQCESNVVSSPPISAGSEAIQNNSISALSTELNAPEDDVSINKDETELLPTKELEEEVFSHGDCDDNDVEYNERKVIDWSAVTLPTRVTDTLEDRLQIFCGGQSRGFHAALAAEATAVSLKFPGVKEQAIQTFRGIGENEEVFGSDDSDTE